MLASGQLVPLDFPTESSVEGATPGLRGGGERGMGEMVHSSGSSASSSVWQWHGDRVQRWRPDIASRGGEGGFPASGGVGGLLVWTRQHSSPGRGLWDSTHDANAHVSEMLAEDGGVASRWDDEAFGNSTHATPGAWPSVASQFTHRFATKPADPDTGLHHCGYRWLDPVTGRWTSRDPIEEEGGVNLYGFVGNDGVNQWDFLGLDPWWVDRNRGMTPEEVARFARSCVDCHGSPVGRMGNASRMRRQAAKDHELLIDQYNDMSRIQWRFFPGKSGVGPAGSLRIDLNNLGI